MDRRRPRSPMGRRGPPPHDFDRRRSRSPPDRGYGGRGRSSPPPYRRNRRDGDPYFDRFNNGQDDFRGGRGARSPPRGDYHDYPDEGGRRGSPPPGERQQGPLSFKQFLLQQHDDPSPEEAQERYRGYLVEYHGSEIKAEFAQTRNDERVRAMFDPRSFEKALAKRNEEAAESATRFAEDLSSGGVDAKSAGFNQGMYELAPKPPAQQPAGEQAAGEGGKAQAAEEQRVAYAPSFCWQAQRLATDLLLSRRLIRKLDWEKGLPDNPLLPRSAEAAAAQAEADAAAAQDAAAAKEEGKDAGGASSKRYVEVEEEAPAVDEGNYEESVAKLDMQLTYLWRVHGIDYYGGYELTASEFPQRLTACRLLRGPKPEDGEQGGAGASTGAAAGGEAGAAAATMPKAGAAGGDKAAADAELAEFTAAVDEGWAKRITEGDPLEARCLRKKVEELLDKWVESQIICHADNKWGNQLSNKLFVARKFVVKHIRTKHEEKLQAEKERILDDLYFENFRAFKEEEARAVEAAAAAQEKEGAMAAEGPGAGQGGQGGPGAVHGGRGGGGRFGTMGGRGGRFGMGRGRGRGMGGMMGGMMMPGMDMAMMPMPMGGPMGPMLIPPGAGPIAPFLPLPMMAAPGMMPMMAPGMMMGGGRGGRGGRGMGGMMGGRGMGMGRGGGRFGAIAMPSAKLDGGGMREYYDLDNPHNNRAVLDYGDL